MRGFTGNMLYVWNASLPNRLKTERMSAARVWPSLFARLKKKTRLAPFDCR